MGETGNDEKKKFLWGYRDSMRRIERIESEIEELRAMRTGASTGSGGGGRKGWKGDLSGYAARLDGLEGALEKEWESRVQAYEQIKEAIDGLEDGREQDVLFYRYIKGLPWWEIAEKMGYSERQIHRFHSGVLTHLKVLKDIMEYPQK